MELKEFITSTINDILDGVVESQKHAATIGAVINPPHHKDSSGNALTYMMGTVSTQMIQKIEFDVAVTITNEDKTKGKISVFSAILNSSVQGEDNQINNQSTRIRFSIPVIFP